MGNDWIQTYTGRQFWPLDPRPEDVDIEDIAHALSMKCRFTGHTQVFYSIAQHSVLVYDIAETLPALLHDAAEAYFADVATPIKNAFPIFREIEDRLMSAIGIKFGFTDADVHKIKYADRIAFATERRDVMGKPPRPYRISTYNPLPTRIEPLLPFEAKALFLERFYIAATGPLAAKGEPCS